MKRFLAIALLGFAAPSYAVDCHVHFFGYVGQDQDGTAAQVPREPRLGDDKVTFTSTSTASDATPAGTRLIGFICTAKAHFSQVGLTPVATTDDGYVPPDQWYYVGVNGNNMKIAFIAGS